MTPADLLRDTYRLMRRHAYDDVCKNLHVPPTLTGIVTSPYNPPELHVYALLDARQILLQMRAILQGDPAVFGFVFLTVGTVLHERPRTDVPEATEALLCLWCHAHDAGGDSYRILRGSIGLRLEMPEPLPAALRDLYLSVFDLDVTLPGALVPTPQ